MNSNDRIRALARVNHVPLWLIADTLGISESTMTRKLRKPITVDEFTSIIYVIEELAKNNLDSFYDGCEFSDQRIKGGDVYAEN